MRRAVRALLAGDHRRSACCASCSRPLLTWAAHSSVATVLLIMSLAYSNFITPAAALALVLGANLGSAINPLLEGGSRERSGELPAAGRQSDQPRRRRRRWCCRSCSRSPTLFTHAAARPGQDDGRVPHRVQCRAGARLHLPAGSAGMAADAAVARAAQAPPTHRRRAISTRPRSIRRRWRWPTPRARRCTWAISSRRCCGRS